MTTREHEQTLNVRLSDELRARSLDAKPEVTHPGNRRVDVEVRVGPARIAVEAEHGQGSGKRREAIGDKVDTHIKTKLDKANLAERYWQQRSTLLLPMRFRLNTVKVVSIRTDTPTVSSSWTPCRISIAGMDVQTLEKVICVFLNSTIGVLALAGNRTNREISYTRFSLDDLHKLIVPDFAAIGESAVARLAAAYDALAERTLLPLPQMDADPVRRALDDAVCDALGLDGERVAAIRRNLAAEPSVTGKRYAGLRPA